MGIESSFNGCLGHISELALETMSVSKSSLSNDTERLNEYCLEVHPVSRTNGILFWAEKISNLARCFTDLNPSSSDI